MFPTHGFAREIPPRDGRLQPRGEPASGRHLKFPSANGGTAPYGNPQATSGDFATFRVVACSAYMRPLFCRIAAIGGARVVKSAGAYIYRAPPTPILRYCEYLHDVTGVDNAFGADTSQLYWRWGGRRPLRTDGNNHCLSPHLL